MATLIENPFWRPRRLGHANLYVSDLEHSMHFYHDVVGLEESYRRPAIKAGFLGNGNTHHDIGLVEVTSPLCRSNEAGLNHLAFELQNEVELVEGYHRAQAANIEFPRTVDHDITRSIYGFDPDGNSVEIYADMTKDWRGTRTGVVTKPTPAWTPGIPPPISEALFHESPEIQRVPSAIFHPLRITHVVVITQDYEAMVEFYRGPLGLRLIRRGEGDAFAVLGGTCGAQDLILFRRQRGWAIGLHHMSFEVAHETELADSIARLAGSKWAIERDMARLERHCVHLRDPDGLRIQFYVERKNAKSSSNPMELETRLFVS